MSFWKTIGSRCEPHKWHFFLQNERATLNTEDARMKPESSVQAANVKRWSADDDAWRGYRRIGGELVLEDRIVETLALLEPVPQGSMLDVGCATGVVTRLMADKALV